MPEKTGGDNPSHDNPDNNPAQNENEYLLRRIAVYIIGLFVLAFGVALSINADLGISPVSSLPFVFSLILDADMGIVVPMTFMVMILLQIILLRKKFKLINLTQIVFSVIFGYFVDAARIIIGDFQIPTYFGQLLLLLCGIVLIASGVILTVRPKLVPLPLEGLVVAIVRVFPNRKFHIVKIIADSALVALAVAASIIFLGRLHAIREGTVLTAVFVGKVIPYIEKVALPVLVRFKIIE